jgi:hypothetical protein
MSSSDAALEARLMRARTASRAKRQGVLASDSMSDRDTVEVDKGTTLSCLTVHPRSRRKQGCWTCAAG